VLTWLAEKCLSPVYVLTWPSEKCLSPVEEWLTVRLGVLLTFLCLRREFESNRRHGWMQGTIITCCRSNLDGTPVLSLRSLRQLARGRVMMYPLRCGQAEARGRARRRLSPEVEAEAEAWGRARRRPSLEAEAEAWGRARRRPSLEAEAEAEA
jgi:hypothetical protein